MSFVPFFVSRISAHRLKKKPARHSLFLFRLLIIAIALLFVQVSASEAATQALTVATTASPATVNPGGTVTVSPTVKNTDTVATTITVWFDVGSPNGVEICSGSWGGQTLQPGESRTFNGSCPIAATAVLGTYVIRVDVYQGSTRTYTNSNAATFSVVAASLPSLAVATTVSPATVNPGGTVTVSPTVKNNGTQATTITVWFDVGSPSGAEICSGSWGGQTLQPGESRTFNGSCVVPATAVTGTYVVRVDVYQGSTRTYTNANAAAFSVVAASVAPGSAAMYWGAHVSGAPWDMSKQDQFESSVSKRASIIPIGGPWKQNGAYVAFPTSMVETMRQHGAFPMMNWGSALAGGGVDQPEFKLSAITSGQHDSFITSWAQAAKAWGKPFFLRFDHEMNAWWGSTWSEQSNGNQPGDYVRMWQHVHDIFTRVGATNATWVWCPNVEDSRTTPLPGLYPGDSYVDWTCLDGYNWAQTQPDDWRSFTAIFTGNSWRPYNSYQDVLNIAPSKPMMIAETASNEYTGDGGTKKAAWISSLLSSEFPNNFPKVRAFLYWDIWVSGEPPWPIDSTSAAFNAFKTGIASTYYNPNWYASYSYSPIPPPTR